MSGLIEFTHYQAEALLICLAASLVWASLLFAGAKGVERSGSMTSAERLWTAALLFAVLPSLVAPTLAAFGVSLRPAPATLDLGVMELVTVANSAPREIAAAAEPALFTMEQMTGTAALIYVYGVVLTLFLWAAQQAGLYYAIARAEIVDDEKLLSRIEDWADRLEAALPEIRRSRHVSSVCIFGVFRQTILIPHGIETRIASDDLVLMCAHELAHVRRGDTRLFTATQLARVLFWFNPLVGQIARHAELAAEESADALVLRKGVDRRAYAACFVEGLKFAAARMNAHPALAPSFTPSDRNGRRRRLNSILSPESAPQRAPLTTRLMASAAASTLALIAVGQAALAVDPDAASDRRRTLSAMPLIGDVTMAFGEKATDKKDAPAHSGLDIKAPKGATVTAPGDGVVVEATDHYRGSPAWGKVVVIDHGHGLVTRYAHLDSYAVRKGDRVKTGEIIARVGATGKVTGPHLHFETLRNGEAVDPSAVIAAAPVLAPSPAMAPSPTENPEPDAAPAPVAPVTMEFSYRLKPAGEIRGVPGIREFTAPEDFPDFKIINPVIAGDAPFAPHGFEFTEPTGFAFAGDAKMAESMALDMEKRLLGALDGDKATTYNLAYSKDGKAYRFSSNEPMTAEKRAELKEALKEMRKDRERAQKEAAKHRDEWRREMARVRIEASRQAKAGTANFSMDADDLAEMQRDIAMGRREALEAQRAAIEEARDDLDETVEESIADALSDLDDAESDLDDAELPATEIASAKASIREQRRQLERNGAVHERAIETARRQLESQLAAVERQLDSLDDESAEE